MGITSDAHDGGEHQAAQLGASLVPEVTYGIGAFTLLTGGLTARPWDIQGIYDLRDQMLQTIYPDTDLGGLNQLAASRAAKLLVRITNGTSNVFGENDRWQRNKNELSAKIAEPIFEGHPGKGLTFKNPGLITSDPEKYIVGELIGPKTCQFIATYTAAILNNIQLDKIRTRGVSLNLPQSA